MDNVNALTGWDYVVLLVAGASMIWGVYKGFIRSVFGVAAWVLAIATPWFFVPLLVPGGFAQLGLPIPVWAANLLTFFLVFLLVHFIGAKLAGMLGKAGLGGTDRFFGALWGAGRALLIMAVIVGIGAVIGATNNEAWAKAKTRPLLDKIYTTVQPLFPNKNAASKPVQAKRQPLLVREVI
jgi:membrane protein required for colicin V production